MTKRSPKKLVLRRETLRDLDAHAQVEGGTFAFQLQKNAVITYYPPPTTTPPNLTGTYTATRQQLQITVT